MNLLNAFLLGLLLSLCRSTTLSPTLPPADSHLLLSSEQAPPAALPSSLPGISTSGSSLPECPYFRFDLGLLCTFFCFLDLPQEDFDLGLKALSTHQKERGRERRGGSRGDTWQSPLTRSRSSSTTWRRRGSVFWILHERRGKDVLTA